MLAGKGFLRHRFAFCRRATKFQELDYGCAISQPRKVVCVTICMKGGCIYASVE